METVRIYGSTLPCSVIKALWLSVITMARRTSQGQIQGGIYAPVNVNPVGETSGNPQAFDFMRQILIKSPVGKARFSSQMTSLTGTPIYIVK